MLYALDGGDVSLLVKLDFLCSNNETKYGALLIRLISVLQMRFKDYV